MEKLEDYTPENLQKCSYRYLQQIAKSLGLPSNVKKLCLIHLIYVKKHYSDEQCEKLVNQVRLERKQASLSRKNAKEKKKSKMAQQISEITSTNCSTSPPITSTPIPIGHITIRYSPGPHSPKKRINRAIATNTTINVSDRVLRSYSAVRKPKYIFNNKILNIMNGTTERYQPVDNIYKCRQVNSGAVVQKNHWQNCNEIVPMRTHRQTNTSPQSQIIFNHKRVPRRVSGIYPLHEVTTPEKYIGIRRSDGTIAKINAYVPQVLPPKEIENNVSHLLTIDSAQSRTTVSNMIENYQGVEIIVTESSSDIPNMAVASYKENSIHYHKKIKSEQMRSYISRCISNDCQLPKINTMFNNFNSWNVRDVTQPIYVQVSNECEIVPKDPVIEEVQSNELNMLENIYNLKNKFIINQPLAQITTTANTHCTYATSIVSTPKAQTSTSVSGSYNNALLVDSSTHDVGDPRVTEFFRNYRCNEGESQCSSESPQSQNANITIPEMVEDAFEVISQDGDYMERMGMDIVMQCIFCEWAGPKMVLEFHIRKDHSSEIISIECCEWHATYSLGTLTTNRSWHNKVLDRASKLYVLSTKYDDPDYFCVIITTLSSAFDNPTTGSITTYNKVTGEPFTWKGSIPELPPNLTYDYDSNCLKLELSKLDLLPNSANIQLLNRELVVKSPGKVVVGQPELHNIHINLIVKLDDCKCQKY